MFTPLFWVVPVFAAADWALAWREKSAWRWITKPAVLILLIVWFSQTGGWVDGLVWFGLGLVFSLLGDVFLQAPARFFLPGVGAFLLAHLAYIAGFLQGAFRFHVGMLVPLVLAAAAFWVLSGRVRAGLKRQGEKTLILPVMVYALVLCLMAFAASTTLFRADWAFWPAVVVTMGGWLFLLSDSVLALNRFVRPIQNADLLVMVTYHLAQVLIASGALFQFVRMTVITL